MKTYETKRQTVTLEKNIQGNILDIGGGGEGIIGCLYGDVVIAIDRRQDELDEAPDGPKKMVMDAGDLSFADNTFDAVTSFFTMMYIKKDQHGTVLKEAYRVLKPKGRLYLWDCVIDKKADSYDLFIIHLKVLLPKETITTGYGVPYREQNKNYYVKLLTQTGFKVKTEKADETVFYLVAEK